MMIYHLDEGLSIRCLYIKSLFIFACDDVFVLEITIPDSHLSVVSRHGLAETKTISAQAETWSRASAICI